MLMIFEVHYGYCEPRGTELVCLRRHGSGWKYTTSTGIVREMPSSALNAVIAAAKADIECAHECRERVPASAANRGQVNSYIRIR